MADRARLEQSFPYPRTEALHCPVIGRGVRLVFVFSQGEPGPDLLNLLAGKKLVRLGEGCRIRVIEGADHIFSQCRPRTAPQEVLSEELAKPSGMSPAAQNERLISS